MSGLKYRTVVPDVEFWKATIPCQAACPIHTDAGKYVQLIAEGKDRESYLTARGGSWYTASIAVLNIAYRENFQPEVAPPYLGFRIVARPLP